MKHTVKKLNLWGKTAVDKSAWIKACKGKAGKEVPMLLRLEFLEKFSTSNFPLKHLRFIILRKYSRFTFDENTASNLLKVT